MNYRHAFHAGNFADVLKHVVVMRVIEYLKGKDKPFRFIDTHAGVGIYDVSGDEAQRTGEWRDGIGRILCPDRWQLAGVAADREIVDLLRPYVDVIRDLNRASERSGVAGMRLYPGAGELARRLLRVDDRLVLNELHPEDARLLRRCMARDERVRTLQLDGWMAVRSLLPPKERRGVMLVDPPFEKQGEFKRLEAVLGDATARFATGVSVLWYPIKEGGAANAFVNHMAASGVPRLLAVELLVGHRDTAGGLNGSGLIVHNPPYGLERQLNVIVPWLAERLGQRAGAQGRVFQLTGE